MFKSKSKQLEYLKENYNWEAIQEDHINGLTMNAIMKKYNLNRNRIVRAVEFGLFVKIKHKLILSPENRKKISDKRKEWLKNNPDKHPWKNNEKFKSIPCENVKNFLRLKGVSFVEEFCPGIDGRSFSIDIAIPDKMIALEINGNQHYESSGILKSYYKERHDLLESHGWIVYEIHYSTCFNLEKWSDFLNIIENSPTKIVFDYFNYRPSCRTPKTKNSRGKECSANLYDNCQCGKRKLIAATDCRDCHLLKRRKVKIRPTKNELELLIDNNPMSDIGKMFGVSDNAVKKWAKKYEINLIPMRGVWAKRRAKSSNS